MFSFKYRLLVALTFACLLLPTLVLAQSPTSRTEEAPRVSHSTSSENVQPIGQIGGTPSAIAAQGNYLYAAIGAALNVLDISNPAVPTKVGQLALPSQVLDVALVGNYAYLATTTAGLWVVDVSNPAAPVRVNSYEPAILADLELGAVTSSVVIDGDYAYVAAGGCQTGLWINNCGYSLSILDIATPTSPTEVGSFNLGGISEIAVSGDYAYLLSYRTFTILNVSNPAAVAVEASYLLEQDALYGVAISGNYVYISSLAGLLVWDVSNPSAATQVGSVHVGLGRVVITGSHAYVMGTKYQGAGNVSVGDASNLWIVDISNPQAPIEVGFYDAPQPHIPSIRQDLTVLNGYVYVLSDGETIRAVSVTDPTAPIEVGSYAPSPPRLATLVAVKDNNSYVSDGQNRVLAIDLTTPTTPVVLDTLETLSDTVNITLSGNHLYLAEGYRLNAVDVSEPSNLTVSGTYATPDNQIIRDIAIAGEYAYLTTDTSLRVVRLSEPENLTEVGSFSQGGQSITISGERAYVSGSINKEVGELRIARILDVSNPAAPTELGYYAARAGINSYVTDIAASGNHAYVSLIWCLSFYGCWSSVEVVDVSNPVAPEWLVTYSPPALHSDGFGYRIQNLSLIGQQLYITASKIGLIVLDVSNPANPKEVGRYDTSGGGTHIAVTDDHLYVADYDAGLLILSVQGSIAGKVIHSNRTPVQGVTISTEDGEQTTDAAGRYTFPELEGPAATLVPRLEDFTFLPPTRTVSLFTDATDVTFIMLAAPVSTTLTPEVSTSLSYSDTQGLLTDLQFPAGAVEVTTTIRLTPTVTSGVPGLAFAEHAFDLVAYQDGKPEFGLDFREPVTLTIRYSDADLRLVNDESELTVRQWNGSAWEDAAGSCAPASDYERDEANNLIRLPICGTGRLALFGPTHQQHLPLMFRSRQ